MRAPLHHVRQTGFTLLPVILAMSLIAAIAFLLNRDNGFNARMTASQSDLDRARYAAEAGLQAANYVIQTKGCGATTYPIEGAPVINNDFGGAAYSAFSTTPGGSPVELVSTGTYNGTSVRLTRENVYVYRSPAQTVVLQPGPTTGQDTHLNIGFPERNYGGSDPLRLYTGSYQPLLKFDFSGLPPGSRVIPRYNGEYLQGGAYLFLWQTAVGPATSGRVNVHLATQSWVAGTKLGETPADGATWNTYDGVDAWPPGMGYASTAVASAPYYNVTNVWGGIWDLTNAVAGWLSGVYPNEGIRLVPTSGVDPTSGASLDIGDTKYASSSSSIVVGGGSGHNAYLARPLLYMPESVLVPCGTSTTVTRELTLVATSDAQVRKELPNHNYGASTLMAVSGPINHAAERHVLVDFNVSSIPSGSTINSAVLRLYANRVDSPTANEKDIWVYGLTKSWREGDKNGAGRGSSDVSWTYRGFGTQKWSIPYGGGGDTGPIIATGREETSGLSPLPANFSNGWVTWDVTALMQAWADGATLKNGIVLASGVTDQIQFNTRENVATTLPELRITYTPPQ